jgi:hypothetical protein
MEEIIEQTHESLWLHRGTVGEKIEKSLTRVFGCRHRQMSLPFTRGNLTYRTCVACGARRDFDLVQRVMVGPYYYPTVRSPR